MVAPMEFHPKCHKPECNITTLHVTGLCYEHRSFECIICGKAVSTGSRNYSSKFCGPCKRYMPETRERLIKERKQQSVHRP